MTPPRILILTSSLLTDRMLRHSGVLAGLATTNEVVVWSSGVAEEEQFGDTGRVRIAPFPELPEFCRYPVEMLRHCNDAVWEHHLQLPSRLDERREGLRQRPRQFRFADRIAPALDHGPVPSWIERAVGRTMVWSMRWSSIRPHIAAVAPDLVVSMCPLWSLESAVAAAAMSLGVPVAAFMTSFDNLSTKRRIELPFDRWLLWSDEQRAQLRSYYHWFPADRIDVVGAPQFDVFHDPRFLMDRAEWCASAGLDPDLPIVVDALGSPNFIVEEPAAHELAGMFERGTFGDAQLVIRPHPIHDDSRLAANFEDYGARVVVQATGTEGLVPRERSQGDDAIRQWVNTFRHADVVVNLSSSVTVDAALLDRPVISLDFDPHPSRSQQRLVRSINRTWPHFAPIARSGGVTMAADMDEAAVAIKAYLDDPSLHRSGRQWIAEFVAGFVDGRNGERLADAISAAAGSAAEV